MFHISHTRSYALLQNWYVLPMYNIIMIKIFEYVPK